MSALGCLVHPVGCVATTVAKSSLGDVFDALTQWVMGAVSWLLRSTGDLLDGVGEPSSIVSAASTEYGRLSELSPVLFLLTALGAVVGSLRRGDAATMGRAVLAAVPFGVVVVLVSPDLARLALSAVDQMTAVGAGTGVHSTHSLAVAVTALSTSSVPGFGLFLLAVLVVIGSLALWCELVVRAVVLTLLLVLVPVIAPFVVMPSTRRLLSRLVETFLAVALSKFLIVVVLALGLSELTGAGVTTVLTGAVTLALASFTPFILLRLVPFLESSAMHAVDGLRQRSTRAVMNAPSSPVGAAAAALLPDAPLPGPPERPEDLGIPMWETGPETDFALPPLDADPPPPPVGTPRLRGGHVAHYRDEQGPIVGWHFDE